MHFAHESSGGRIILWHFLDQRFSPVQDVVSFQLQQPGLDLEAFRDARLAQDIGDSFVGRGQAFGLFKPCECLHRSQAPIEVHQRGWLPDHYGIEGLCAETASAMISAAIADRKQNGYVLDSTILDIRGTSLLAARILDKAPPIMVVQFEAQQIHCIMDKKGAIVEGADDEIRNNFYCIAMQRDWDEDEQGLKWKILEFMILGGIPYQ